MKIVSDNPEILEELNRKLKQEGIRVKSLKAPLDTDDKGIFEDIVQLIIENPEESKIIIETIVDEVTSMYRQEHIYVVQKNGKKIPYAKYKTMSKQELSEHIF